jgi:TPR repeat protein
MLFLGLLYHNGKGVQEDIGRAHHWYKKSAELDLPVAMTMLGGLHEGMDGHLTADYAEARRWYEKVAALGDSLAMYRLGVLYSTGYDAPPDQSRARRRYEKAAALGNNEAKEALKTIRRDRAAGGGRLKQN